MGVRRAFLPAFANRRINMEFVTLFG
ncbi:hypothetical protein AvCA_27930 [Azotobacter vinelandii CA]|uniref:Uncharacterized protein n=2 Tax=Azotobacter vinelandii TaxID=354 RepID=C1DKW3_AZOVD|nr:hypothetical protein Avin_27930 [Azotobacter vinelandii DJ]AGK16543.1 hypothetical protein AvCA_27930 [Azotobacter vinelandii CA]AGK20876.1 hypothetical protein AvCA6_27930 [Azotobacter vinelandii CA6]